MDRATANLPSSDFARTVRFYEAIGFGVQFRDDGWLILRRGTVQLEFFPCDVDPLTTIASSCIRVDELDALYAAFSGAGLPTDCYSTPRLTPPEMQGTLRLFALVDPDGNLLRCIDNRSTQDRWPD